MTDFYSDAMQSAYREYLYYQRLLGDLGEFVVPQDEMNAFLSVLPKQPMNEHASVIPGGGAIIEAFVRRRVFAEFVGLVLADDDQMCALHTYSHDENVRGGNELQHHGERQLAHAMSRAAGPHQIAPGDIVLVEAATFDGDIAALQRVLHALTDTGALIFVDQFGIANPLTPDALERWFDDDSRNYVPMKRGLLDGLFRPILPTGPYSWG